MRPVRDLLLGLAGSVARRPPPGRGRSPRPRVMGGPAPAFEGLDLHGAPVGVVPGDGERRVLLFLTSSCAGCERIWAGVSPHPGLVVVTPDTSTESTRSLRRLAPAGLTVVMSSAAWFAYGVPGSPWLVVVEAGTVRGEIPSPAGWEVVAAELR